MGSIPAASIVRSKAAATSRVTTGIILLFRRCGRENVECFTSSSELSAADEAVSSLDKSSTTLFEATDVLARYSNELQQLLILLLLSLLALRASCQFLTLNLVVPFHAEYLETAGLLLS